MPKSVKVVVVIVVLLWISVIGFAVTVTYYSRAHGPAGHVNVTTPSAELTLRTGYILEKSFTISNEDSPVSLASGVYRPGKISISNKQGEDSWKLESFGPSWGALSTITVDQDEMVELKFGPPLVAKADVIIDGRYVSIGYTIVGQGGEQYETITRNSRSLGLPKFEIVDEKGNILQSDQFEYG